MIEKGEGLSGRREKGRGAKGEWCRASRGDAREKREEIREKKTERKENDNNEDMRDKAVGRPLHARQIVARIVLCEGVR